MKRREEKNELLEYYNEYNLSPEHQDIEEIEIHYARRQKLYRQCGMPEIAFRNAEILEVGPGRGDNTLAFFHWNCAHVDLVEANAQECKDMQILFAEQEIPRHKYDIFECTIENYCTDKKYDIIIAEGFLPLMHNQEEIICKLKELLKEKGIIVITCVDKVGYFIEIMKRMGGIVLSQKISAYEEKVKYLTEIFRPQLKKLRGVSKLPEGWVMDNILSPAVNNGEELSVSKAIQYFDKDFDILGTSPQMFTDYSWSKDIWYDYKKDYLEQFDKKRLSFLMANMPEIILPASFANELVRAFEDIKDLEAEFEQSMEISKVSDILKIMKSIQKPIEQNFDTKFVRVFFEIEEMLLHIQKSESINMEDYPHFFAAFGRTQQYISFVRK